MHNNAHTQRSRGGRGARSHDRKKQFNGQHCDYGTRRRQLLTYNKESPWHAASDEPNATGYTATVCSKFRGA